MKWYHYLLAAIVAGLGFTIGADIYRRWLTGTPAPSKTETL